MLNRVNLCDHGKPSYLNLISLDSLLENGYTLPSFTEMLYLEGVTRFDQIWARSPAGNSVVAGQRSLGENPWCRQVVGTIQPT